MKYPLRWPRTLASRLSLIFLIGLILAQALSFGAQYYERYETAKNTMLGNLETDVSTSIAILDRLPAAERPEWTKRLQRRNYDYLLREHDAGSPWITAKQFFHLGVGLQYLSGAVGVGLVVGGFVEIVLHITLMGLH